MVMFDVDELVNNMTRSFISREADLFDDGPGTLDLWDQDDEQDDMEVWTDPEFYKDPSDAIYKSQGFAQETQTLRENPELLKTDRYREMNVAQRQLTTGDFTRMMLAREGEDYEWGGTSRAGGFDCSGLIWKMMSNLGIENFPRHSSAIYEHSKKISLKNAIKTRGAILYKEGHIAISLGNGKTIEAMGEDYGVVKGNAVGRFTHGGLLPELQVGDGHSARARSLLKPAKKGPLDKRGVEAVNPIASDDPFSSFSSSLPLLTLDIVDEIQRPVTGNRPTDSKDSTDLNSVERQMRKGFIEAGRPDLARMVGTKAFTTWVDQESGWVRDRTSAANNQGKANDGYFQVWRGHDYNANGEVAQMSAREQAYLIATRFDLTAADIQNYAKQIRQGEYVGWG